MKTLLAFVALAFSFLQASTQQTPDTIRVHFPFDRSVLTSAAQATLDSFVTAYKSTPTPTSLQIRGHCDAIGSLAYNESLSTRRTVAVQQYLHDRGIPDSAISFAQGFGERLPLNKGRTPEERRLNRRVEIILSHPVATAPQPPPTPPVPIDTTPVFSPQSVDTAKEGSTLRLRNINFYGGRHTFLPQAMPALNELLEVMKANPSLIIEIQGHICCRYGWQEDGIDYDAGDMNLSYNRARAVYYYLAEHGIDKRRMTYRGFAGTRPLVWPEASEADRTLNRRVEIKIVKK